MMKWLLIATGIALASSAHAFLIVGSTGAAAPTTCTIVTIGVVETIGVRVAC